MIAQARLIKRISANGLMEVNETVPLGKLYNVIAESRRTIQCYHQLKRKHWEGEFVQDADTGEWLLVELLSFRTQD